MHGASNIIVIIHYGELNLLIKEQKGWCLGNKVANGGIYNSQILHTENGGGINTDIDSYSSSRLGIQIYPNPCKNFITFKGIQEKCRGIQSYSIVSLNGNNQTDRRNSSI